MKVPYAKAKTAPRCLSVKEDQQTFLAYPVRLGVDWPPYGYWTDEELAEMSRPRKSFDHDNHRI